MGKLLVVIEHLDPSCVASIAIILTSAVCQCLSCAKRHKLPSLAQGAVWSAFHNLRGKPEIIEAWQTFILSSIPVDHRQEHQLALQVIMDRILKQILKNRAEAARPKQSTLDLSRPLTLCESNAIRYMAGYVAVKLLKKYQRKSKNHLVVMKYKFFTKVLCGMKASEQPGQPDSLIAYSTLWKNLLTEEAFITSMMMLSTLLKA